MEVALDKIESGLKKYLTIMKRLNQVDVSADPDFQRLFNGYYRMRQRPAIFYASFYTYLEQQKANTALTFHDVLTYLYRTNNAIMPSFASKLLATVRPEMPVWDKYVLQNLGLKAPYYYQKDRMEKTEKLYDAICEWYKSDEAAEKLAYFKEHFPDMPISDTKKIDMILWQTR